MHCAVPAWLGVRVDPFTSAHMLLQNGEFDAADRLFTNVTEQFRGATAGQCCEEHIAELFFEPRLLRNENALQLGTKRNGCAVNDVALPCGVSAFDAVDCARAVLES